MSRIQPHDPHIARVLAWELQRQAASDAAEISPELRPSLRRLLRYALDPEYKPPEPLSQDLEFLRIELGVASLDEYLIDLRLGAAPSLLAVADLSIAKVGMLLGYPEPSNFSAAFEARFGMAPSAVTRVEVREGTSLSTTAKTAMGKLGRQLARDIGALPAEEARQRLAGIVGTLPELAEELVRMSREESDCHRRVELAELAFEHVEDNAVFLGERYRELHELAQTSLVDAQIPS